MAFREVRWEAASNLKSGNGGFAAKARKGRKEETLFCAFVRSFVGVSIASGWIGIRVWNFLTSSFGFYPWAGRVGSGSWGAGVRFRA